MRLALLLLSVVGGVQAFGLSLALGRSTRVLTPDGPRAASIEPTMSEADLPTLVVLDLDMSPEMYELYDMPSAESVIRGDLNGRGEGVTGVYSGNRCIRLFPGALAALQEAHDGKYPGLRLAVASSADTPLAERIGRAAMKVLEIVPGVTMHEVLTADYTDGRNLQIGRQAPLSSDKSRTHFPILQRELGVPYEEMLFFDDSVWSDHCSMVEQGCPGVVTQRTPRGMTVQEWEAGLRKFAAAKASRS